MNSRVSYEAKSARIVERTLSALVFAYIFSILTLSGLPLLSRLSVFFVTALFTVCTLLVVGGQFRIKSWVIGPGIFLLLCILWALPNYERSLGTLGTVFVTWVGAILVGLCLNNGVRPKTVVIALSIGAIVNIAAVALGFDAYVEFSADLSDTSELILRRRASGLLGNSNLFAIYLVLPLYLMAYWRDSTGLLLWSLGITCALYAVVVTGSRQGLYLALMFIPYLFLQTRSIGVRSFLGMLCALVFGLIFVIFGGAGVDALPPMLRELEVFHRIDLYLRGGDASFNYRVVLFEAGLEGFFESPLIGHGLNSFRYLAGDGYYAHNNFIELAFNGGLVLLLSYYLLHAFAIVRLGSAQGWRAHREYGAVFFVLVLLGLDFAAVSYYNRLIIIALVVLISTRSRHSHEKQGNVAR